MHKVMLDIMMERQRQIEIKGRTLDADDLHHNFELARYGACFALHASKSFDLAPDLARYLISKIKPFGWGSGWSPQRDQKKYPLEDRRADFVKSAALMVAEIERIDRLIELQGKTQGT